MTNDGAFRRALLEAAQDQAGRYVRIVEEFGEMTPDARERFGRVVARIFVDGASWTLAGVLYRSAEHLSELGQIEPIAQVQRMLSEMLNAAGVHQETTSGGDRAGQDDQGTIEEI